MPVPLTGDPEIRLCISARVSRWQEKSEPIMSEQRMSLRFLMLAVVPTALALTALRHVGRGSYETFSLHRDVLYSLDVVPTSTVG
jgi:hypothetical protein